MRYHHPYLGYSATDLTAFASCGQRTLLDRLRAMGKASVNVYPDPRLDLLRHRGAEHERAYLETLRAEGSRVFEFEALSRDDQHPAAYVQRSDQTIQAMHQGHDVIYQGTLYDGEWLGLADFLIRVERPSRLGDWSYEVADAKLAREARASALLQTCVYSELVERIQGVEPEHVHLYLGGPNPRRETFRLSDFSAYYRSLVRRFREHVERAGGKPPRAPEPVDLCQYCDWRSRCEAEREDADHLSLVAGITRDHRRALSNAGTHTLNGLAELPLNAPPAGLRRTGFERIREQARVQREGRRRAAPYYETIPLEVGERGRALGLLALPEPSPNDWFFDIEGADYAFDAGLEYLFGVAGCEDGYTSVWALTPTEERRAAETFLALATAHIQAHPDAHIYHYGHYETSALKRLVARYGAGTSELDALLERQAFVDLHRIVKQSVRASVKRYSIKDLEPFSGYERAIPLTEASAARRRLEYALALGHLDEVSDHDKPLVEAYNRDDCVSARRLRDWLESLRAECEAECGRTLPRPGLTMDDEKKPESEYDRETRELITSLTKDVSDDRGERNAHEEARWLAAHLLEWHRREDKSAWWEYHHLRQLSDDELIEENKPLSGLEYSGVVDSVKRSDVHRFTFPPQDHRLRVAKRAFDLQDDSRADREVWDLDELNRFIDLKVGKTTKWDPGSVKTLLPPVAIRNWDHRDRLRTIAELLLEGEQKLMEWSPVAQALLHRTTPRFADVGSLPQVAPKERLLDRAVSAALTQRDGVLPVQGPPGTGKTYIGARMIRALLRSGLTVGVTGPSHKVITNLLDAVCEADKDDAATEIVALQVTKGAGCLDPRVVHIPRTKPANDERARRVSSDEPNFNLIAGTSWHWSAEACYQSVDALFVDEAGQFSLANALAVAHAASRMVLLGDPKQLNQPQKGVHPPGSDVSVLEHLAEEDGMISDQHGLFLYETWRMRPEITEYTSPTFYKGRLKPHQSVSIQRLLTKGDVEQHGVFLVEVEHEGNRRESVEEAETIVELYRSLLVESTTFTNIDANTRVLTVEDFVVVAPYNAQVSLIRDHLSSVGFPDAAVGTVDKFQGQQAAIAIYSLASSSAADAPRGMGFLFAGDRLNVATSRARCATIVVANPRLFTAECTTPEQMRMVNAFVRFEELARPLNV